MKFILPLILLLGLAACNTTRTYLISDKSTYIDIYYRDGKGLYTTFGVREVDGLLAIFRLAVPLNKAEPEESKTDVVFTYMVGGAEVSKFILHRDGELFHDGKWFMVDKEWLYRWQSKNDRRNSRKPNE